MEKIFISENFLSKNECDNILKTIFDKTTLEVARIGSQGGHIHTQLRKSSTSFITELGDLNQKLVRVLSDKVKVKGGNPTNLSDFQLTKYDVGDYFNWHIDPPHRDYTIIIFLNNDYQGGELEIKDENEKVFRIEKKEGKLVVFPSFLFHRVTKIEKGIRYSLVNWVAIEKTLNYKKTLI
jgi:predicted 2-oxoglutarate/Fe(II)-dependent dioxygenase YbiX